MRTSHQTMKKLIAEEKLKITDEELFSSGEFAGYLTDIVEACTKRYQRSLDVCLAWLTPGDYIAFTDNKNIHINSNNYLTRSLETRELMVLSLIGLAGHEAAHMLFTDFAMLNTYMEQMAKGWLYPEDNYDLGENFQDNYSDFMALLMERNENELQAVLCMAKDLINIMEDAYVEAKICVLYPGSIKRGIDLDKDTSRKKYQSLSELFDRGVNSYSLLRSCFYQYCQSGSVLWGGYTGICKKYFEACKPVIDEAIYHADSAKRFIAVNKILMMAWEVVKEQIALLKAKQEGTDKTMDQVYTAFILLDGSGGKTSPLPEGLSTTPVPNEEASDEKAEKPSTAHDAAPGLEKIIDQLAEMKAIDCYESNLTRQLQSEANKLPLAEIHRDVKIVVHRKKMHLDAKWKSEYQKAAKPLLLVSKQLRRKVAPLLQDKVEGAKQRGLIYGKRLDTKSFYRPDSRFFYNNKLPMDSFDLAVALVVDESGSMEGERIEAARNASIILYDFCTSLGIPIAVTGHSTDPIEEDVDLYCYADFDSVDGNDKYRLMEIRDRWANRDGAALCFAAERLLKRAERTRMLIIISDGQPFAIDYCGEEAINDTKEIVRKYRKKGMQFIAAAIGSDQETIHKIYGGKSFLDITDLSKLPVNLAKIISKEITKS